MNIIIVPWLPIQSNYRLDDPELVDLEVKLRFAKDEDEIRVLVKQILERIKL